jgi:hypothetical protein
MHGWLLLPPGTGGEAMRTRLYDLSLELEYARQRLQQAQIAAATAERTKRDEATLAACRREVRKWEVYLERVRREYEGAQLGIVE